MMCGWGSYKMDVFVTSHSRPDKETVKLQVRLFLCNTLHVLTDWKEKLPVNPGSTLYRA